MKIKKLKQKYNSLKPRQKKEVIAMTAGLATTLTVMGWVAFAPDKHSSLEKWDDEYSDKCYSHDQDEPLLKSRYAFNRISNTLGALDKSYPHGVVAASKVDASLLDATWCYGGRYNESTPVSHWVFANVEIIDEDYSDTQLAANIFEQNLQNFWSDAVINMEVRLVADDVLRFSRFQRGLQAVYAVDQLHSLYSSQHRSDVFESDEWKALEENQFYGSVAQSYRQGYESGPLTSQQRKSVLLSSLQSFLSDAEALNEDDLRLMRSYYPRLEDSYNQCVMKNSDGICTLNITHYTGPSHAVHANGLKPEYLVDLAALTFFAPEGEGFLSLEDATEMLGADYMVHTHSEEATNQWARVKARIAKHKTESHYNGRAVNPDELFNAREFHLTEDKADNAPVLRR